MLSVSPRLSADFQGQLLSGLLFLALVLLAGAPHFSGGTSTAKMSLLILNHDTWVWGQPAFVSPRLLTSLVVAAFLYPFYRRSVQLDLRWFPGMSFLSSSCNLDVVVGGEHSATSSTVLTGSWDSSRPPSHQRTSSGGTEAQKARHDLVRYQEACLPMRVMMSPRPKRRMSGRGWGGFRDGPRPRATPLQ